MKTKTPCCEYEWDNCGDPGPIFWNPFNRTVQCHSCGENFSNVPDAPKWVSEIDRELPTEGAIVREVLDWVASDRKGSIKRIREAAKAHLCAMPGGDGSW